MIYIIIYHNSTLIYVCLLPLLIHANTHTLKPHTAYFLPDDLFALLSGGRGLSEVYLALLRVVMEEEEDHAMRKELKPTKKKRDLEEIARRYLHKAGKNVSW